MMTVAIKYCAYCGHELKPTPERFVSGLYRVYWTDDEGGGSSLAAIGQNSSGQYWFAPTNWITGPALLSAWRDKIERFEVVELDGKGE